MDQKTFEDELIGDGYQVIAGGMQPNHVNPEHAHDFDARVMVLAGEIAITRDGETITYGPGDSCSVPRGCLHAERVGPAGVAYVAGRRTPN